MSHPRQGPGHVRLRLAGAVDHGGASRRRPSSTCRPTCSTPTSTERPGLPLQPMTRRPHVGRPRGDHGHERTRPASISSATRTRTSRGSRSTTPSAATPTTRRCGAPCGTYLDELATDDDIKVVILRGATACSAPAPTWPTPTRGTATTATRRRPSQRRRLGVDRESFGFYHELPDVPEGHRRAGRDLRARRWRSSSR